MKTDQFLGDSFLNPLCSDQSLQMFSLNQEFPVLHKLEDATASVLDFWLRFHESGWHQTLVWSNQKRSRK